MENTSNKELNRLVDEFFSMLDARAMKVKGGDEYKLGYLSALLRIMVLTHDSQSSASFIREHIKSIKYLNSKE